MQQENPSQSDRFEFQITMLQKGAEELEKKIANFTTSLLQIKTATITIWTALIGWSFSVRTYQIIFVGYVVIVSFWFLEAVYWRVQVSYIRKASVLANYLNDLNALNDTFRNKLVPKGLVYPLASLDGESKVSFFRALKAPSIAVFYGFLLVSTSILLGISSTI